MENKNNKRLFLHLPGWILVFVFFFWMFWGERPQAEAIRFAIIITFICSLVFYSHQNLLKLFNRKKRFRYLAGVFLLLGSGPFLLTLGLNNFSLELSSYLFLPFLLLTAVFIILSWMFHYTEKWVFTVLKRKDQEKQKVSAELAYLKSQINPHFLFNTLNNIHTLAYKQSPDTPEVIMRLASMMRYMIYESNAEQVYLTREIEYLKDYIELQQLRTQNSKVADFQVVGDVDSIKIAPLLLIPLLENAFKHSSTGSGSDSIKMSLRAKDNELDFFISNPVANNKKRKISDEGGIGMDNLNKRLQLLYPGKHKLEVISESGFYNVNLIIRDVKKYDERTIDMHCNR